jgi:hypothetical protein
MGWQLQLMASSVASVTVVWKPFTVLMQRWVIVRDPKPQAGHSPCEAIPQE